MNAILIEPKDHKEEKLLSDLLKKLQVSSRKLSIEEQEDFAMGLLMKDADRRKKVSRDVVMKKLSS